MFDIGWTELLVIGIVALIVVGPKDLPIMFRTLGRFTGKARGMARDFQRAMDQAANEAGVNDINSTLRKAANPKSMGVDALKDATKSWTSSVKPGEDAGLSKSEAMTPEREEMAKKIHDATAKKAQERQAEEAAVKGAGDQPTAPSGDAEEQADTKSQ